MAGKGGGAWKVAYADFVTAMMAFFMVMWITAQSKPVKQAIAKYFSEPWLTSGNSAGHDTPVPRASVDPLKGDSNSLRAPGIGFADPGKKVRPSERKPSVAEKKPSLSVLHDGDRRTVGTVVPFAHESAELTEEGKQRLQRVVPTIMGKRNKIEIRGHAIRRPSAKGNEEAEAWQLCYARCVAVERFLESQGIEPERFRLSQAGVFEPQTLRTELQKQDSNSRVELYVLAEFVEDFIGTKKERAERLRTN